MIKTKEELLLQRKELLKKHKYLDAQITRNYNALKKIQKEEDNKIIENWDNDYEWLLYENAKTSKEKYEFRNKILSKLGIDTFGYFTETNQCQIKISMYSNNIVSALQTILPSIKPVDINKIGIYKSIYIMDKDCSEFGSHNLIINEETQEYKIIKLYYSTTTILKEFNTLDSAIKWIETNLF